jgi:hypothetical protein
MRINDAIKSFKITISLYGLSAVLAILWAIAAFQLQSLLIYIGILVVQTPALTPPGWNNGTIVGLSKCTVFILGILWLGLSLYTHTSLSQAQEDHHLWGSAARMVILVISVYVLSAGLLYLLG